MSQSGLLNISNSLASVETLTGNSGGAVSPTAGNINIVGTGAVTVTGDAGTSTLTISVTGAALVVTPVSSTPYTILSTDQFLAVDVTSAAITVNLPNAPTTGQYWVVKDSKGNSATNNITVTTVGGSVTLDGQTGVTMAQNYSALTFIFDGSNYEIY